MVEKLLRNITPFPNFGYGAVYYCSLLTAGERRFSMSFPFLCGLFVPSKIVDFRYIHQKIKLVDEQ